MTRTSIPPPEMAGPLPKAPAPEQPSERRQSAPVVVPLPPAAPAPQPPATAPSTPTQPRIFNPAAPPALPAPPAVTPPIAPAQPPSPPPADPLPMQPGPPPPRPDPVPAPPNRANVTPPRQAGGGIASLRPEDDLAGSNERAQVPSVGVGAALATPPRVAAKSVVTPEAPANRIEEARRLLARGKVHEARAKLEAAIATTPALALLELGRTYDPYFLGMLNDIDDGSQPRRAASLYNEAILHGSPTAGGDLDRLRSTHPGLR